MYVASCKNDVTWDLTQVFVPAWRPVGEDRWVCSSGLVSSVVEMGLSAAGWEERSTASSPLHQEEAVEAQLKITSQRRNACYRFQYILKPLEK